MSSANGELPTRQARFRKGDRYVDLTVTFDREGGKITALCKELGTASFGDSLDEADDAIAEAIVLHLNSLDDVGELEQFCAKHNVPIYQVLPKWSLVDEGEALGIPA